MKMWRFAWVELVVGLLPCFGLIAATTPADPRAPRISDGKVKVPAGASVIRVVIRTSAIGFKPVGLKFER